MEMESLHNSNQAETAEPGPSSQPASYRDAQVWKDIEAETGFASYADYLEYHMDVRPDFRSKLEKVNVIENNFIGDRTIRTVIWDLSMEESYPFQPSLRCCCHSGTELIKALRKPPDGVCVQLVLWHRTDSPLNQEMVDTLGLGLRLDPEDFEYREPWSPPPRKSGPRIRSIFGLQMVAATSQGFMLDVANEVPVVLVASAGGSSFWGLLGSTINTDNYEKPPFCKSPLPEVVRADGYVESTSLDYARAVQNHIVHGREVQPTKPSLLLASMSPLLYVEVYRMTYYINTVQTMYTNIVFGVSDESGVSSQELLDKHRTELRRITEVDEDILDQFSRYLGSEGHPDLSNEPSYVSVVARLRSLIADARRLEAEVRDFKQIQIGDLALRESQKSIELSNAQMELSNVQIREAKSVKIFTILAFFYVPLNLATSIFGMNVQQLNGSGQQIWVFFMISVAALLITGGSWRLVTHKAVLWYKERPAFQPALDESECKSQEYGLLLRIAMLVWLVRNGLTSWMLKSGAGAAILTNSNVKLISSRQLRLPARSACDHVFTFSSSFESAYDHGAFSSKSRKMAIWSTPLGNLLSRHPKFVIGWRNFDEAA